MAVQTKVGSFDVNTSTGNQSITGVGFLPQWVFFMSTGQTAYDTFSNDMDMSLGFTSDECANVYWVDGGTTAKERWYSSGGGAARVFANRTTHGAELISLDSDGFTIDVITAPGTATKVSYLAVGGMPVGAGGSRKGWTTGATSGGDAGIFTTPYSSDLFINFATYTNRFVDGREENDGRLSIGWATRHLGDDMSVSQSAPGGGPLTIGATLYDNRCLRFSNPGSDFDGHMNTIDTGWNMTYDDPPNAFLDGVYAWTMLDLGQDTTYVASGTDTQKTSTGTKSTSLGFRPKAVIFATIAQTTRNSTHTDGAMCIGYSDGTNQAAIYGGGDGGSNPFSTNRYHADGSCLLMADYTDTLNAEATCTFTGDGFTLDWTTADSTARDFIYLAFSDELGADFIPQIYRRL
jgi:hypothetical protein